MKETAKEFLRFKKIVDSEIEWVAPLLTEFAQQAVKERDKEIEEWIDNNKFIHIEYEYPVVYVDELSKFLQSKTKQS